MTSTLPTLAKGTDGTYAKYAWPGGYPIFYLTADNGVMCPDCANGDRSSAPDLDPECPDDDQWRIIAAECNWEDPDLYCENCNNRIESAYAEDK
jgi:hypothetical protein